MITEIVVMHGQPFMVSQQSLDVESGLLPSLSWYGLAADHLYQLIPNVSSQRAFVTVGPLLLTTRLLSRLIDFKIKSIIAHLGQI